MGMGDYVLGLEPGTQDAEGRDTARKDKTLKYLKPGESADFNLTIGVASGLLEV